MWQELLDQPNIALGWNGPSLALQSQDSIFENKTIIGTGAGGKDGKLRSYFIFTPAKKQSFVPETCDKLYGVLKETVAKLGCEIEGANPRKGFVLVSVLIPFEIAADQFAGAVLDKLAKGNGRILRYHYFITNANMPTDSEIREYMIFVEKENIH